MQTVQFNDWEYRLSNCGAVATVAAAADGDAGGDDDADRPDLGLHDSIIFACHVE